MNPFVFGMKGPEHGWLEPALGDLLLLSRQEAARRDAHEVALEHFLLGTLVLNDARVISLFFALGLDPTALRGRILEKLGPLGTAEDDGEHVPLSQELQICLDQAIAATHASGSMLVPPEHLLLSVFSRQWKLSSDTLLERLSMVPEWQALLPVCTELAHQERRLLFYTQNLVHFLSRSQECACSFADLVGLDQIKKELRAIIDTVAAPPDPQQKEKRKPHEILIVGSPYTTGRRLAEAVACEVGTRLLSFAFAGLVTMCAPFTIYREVKWLKDQRISPLEHTFSLYGIALAQAILQRFFLRVHQMSPCVLLIEDIDVSDFTARTRLDAIRDQLLALLLQEIEQLTEGGRVIVIATATSGVDIALEHLVSKDLWRKQHFAQMLLVPEKTFEQASIQMALCPSCKRTTPSPWKHCAYCGSALANICPMCGATRPLADGVRFCFECGYQWDVNSSKDY